MKTNEGLADRTIRVIVGLGLLSLLAWCPASWWALIGLVGLIPLVTGLVGYCPTYTLFGIDTTGRQPHQTQGGQPWTGYGGREGR